MGSREVNEFLGRGDIDPGRGINRYLNSDCLLFSLGAEEVDDRDDIEQSIFEQCTPAVLSLAAHPSFARNATHVTFFHDDGDLRQILRM